MFQRKNMCRWKKHEKYTNLYRLQECILVFVTFLDVDMRVAVCHYIIKNIAGQFCAVVEEECNALLLGTKDGKPVFVPPPLPFHLILVRGWCSCYGCRLQIQESVGQVTDTTKLSPRARGAARPWNSMRRNH